MLLLHAGSVSQLAGSPWIYPLTVDLPLTVFFLMFLKPPSEMFVVCSHKKKPRGISKRLVVFDIAIVLIMEY